MHIASAEKTSYNMTACRLSENSTDINLSRLSDGLKSCSQVRGRLYEYGNTEDETKLGPYCPAFTSPTAKPKQQ